MDPTATLAMARDAMLACDYHLAAWYYEELDQWVSSGGFLPSDWMRNHL